MRRQGSRQQTHTSSRMILRLKGGGGADIVCGPLLVVISTAHQITPINNDRNEKSECIFNREFYCFLPAGRTRKGLLSPLSRVRYGVLIDPLLMAQGIEYFVQMHLDGAGREECDHWHDDAGKRHVLRMKRVENSLSSWCL